MRTFLVERVAFERSLLADLRCPIMSGSTDAELAMLHRCSVRYVRALRDEMQRDALAAEVVALAEQILAAEAATNTTPGEVVLRALRNELARVSFAEAAE